MSANDTNSNLSLWGFGEPHSCRVCEDIAIPWAPDTMSSRRVKQLTMKEVLEGAKAKCAFCLFLAGTSADGTVELQDGVDEDQEFFYDIQTTLDNAADVQWVHYRTMIKMGGSSITSKAQGWLSLVAEEDDPAATKVSARPFVQDPSGEETLTFLKERLQNCLENHEECCERPEGLRPPPRLLEIPDDLENQPIQLKVIDEGDAEEDISYVALSYRWGGEQPMKTTSENLEERVESGLPLSSLPRTFQDAITLTSNLGLKYLWIDSMCMVSDNIPDIEKHYANISHIYQGATMVLSASRAANVSDGFLKPRTAPTWHKSVFRFPFHALDGTIGSVLAIGNLERTSGVLATPEEPVASRAWCLQEYLLSQRFLSVGQRTTMFKCLEEEHFDGAEGLCYSHTGLGPDTLEPSNILYGEVPSISDMEEWFKYVVAPYSGRDHTVNLDKLVAIGGVAEDFSRRPGLDGVPYAAGLWLHAPTFPLQMLWWPKEEENGSAQLYASTQYRAPSWSWASIDGPVQFSPITEDLMELVSPSFKLKGTSGSPVVPEWKFGPLRSGRLHIEGKVMTVKVTPDGKHLVHPNFPHAANVGRIRPDTLGLQTDWELECLELIGYKEWTVDVPGEGEQLRYQPPQGVILLRLRNISDDFYCRFGTYVLVKRSDEDDVAKRWFESAEVRSLIIG
ncbi:uncharacterized protein MKZ38_010242 [Zalerion maritima]|uniref:Heterokaryon incompatibility domain-containing protein n=1 Tax=Zalerion maritima TaxID=339359 RepID=A0AAD5RSI3_9PEZI|nr:uncharacterized protein MKZ38_010242 [Zalerion maritima]